MDQSVGRVVSGNSLRSLLVGSLRCLWTLLVDWMRLLRIVWRVRVIHKVPCGCRAQGKGIRQGLEGSKNRGFPSPESASIMGREQHRDARGPRINCSLPTRQASPNEPTGSVGQARGSFCLDIRSLALSNST